MTIFAMFAYRRLVWTASAMINWVSLHYKIANHPRVFHKSRKRIRDDTSGGCVPSVFVYRKLVAVKLPLTFWSMPENEECATAFTLYFGPKVAAICCLVQNKRGDIWNATTANVSTTH